jgi:hypothetical protein
VVVGSAQEKLLPTLNPYSRYFLKVLMGSGCRPQYLLSMALMLPDLGYRGFVPWSMIPTD